jgi:DNA-binding MarR family transcriptional regulator
LKQLEREGCLRLSGGSGRNKNIHLTEAGLDLAARTVRPVLRMEELAFLDMTGEDRERLLTLHRQRMELLLHYAEPLFHSSQEE